MPAPPSWWSACSRAGPGCGTWSSKRERSSPGSDPPCWHPDCTLTSLDVRECNLDTITGILRALKVRLIDDADDDSEFADPATAPSAKTAATRVVRMERLLFGLISTEEEVEALKSVIPNLPGLQQVAVQLPKRLSKCREDMIDAFNCNATLATCLINREEIVLIARKNPAFKVDRTAAMKRKISLRNILSGEEIERINAKDAFLQSKKSTASRPSSSSSIGEDDSSAAQSDRKHEDEDDSSSTQTGTDYDGTGNEDESTMNHSFSGGGNGMMMMTIGGEDATEGRGGHETSERSVSESSTNGLGDALDRHQVNDHVRELLAEEEEGVGTAAAAVPEDDDEVHV
jgi:hypothetical protein